jgi:hypothetical protein
MPASIDSIGNPGIPCCGAVVVFVTVVVVFVEKVCVEVTAVTTPTVEVDTVFVTVVVAASNPPKGENKSMVDKGIVPDNVPPIESDSCERVPTIQPLLGDIM